MLRVIALTQLLIVGLMGPALHLLVRIAHEELQPEALSHLAHFLARHVLWFFAIPILFTVAANALRNRVDEKLLRIAGVATGVILVLLFGIPIALYLI